MTSEINITMLGPSRVGKTSLLASLYYKIPDVLQDTNLSLTPDMETRKSLDGCLEELHNLANTRDHALNDGIRGDDVKKSFHFNLGLAAKKPAFRLNFQDYPGGWIQKSQDSEDFQQVIQFIRDSQAILIPIDTPALFERNEGECNKINEISTVSYLIEEVFNQYLQNDESPRLIILVPLKCEKYLRSTEYSYKIQTLVRERYKKLLTYVNQRDLSDRLAVVLTPVQTTGNVMFNSISRDHNRISKFTTNGSPFSPQDTDQPLRYLLRFILNVYLEKRRWSLFEGLRQVLTGDSKLNDCIGEFSKGCKNNTEFVVLQGQHWLSKKK